VRYRAICSGFFLTVIRDCPACGTYFASYEWLVRKLSVDGKSESLTIAQLLLAGGSAGILSWLINYPADVIKTRFQADAIDTHNIAYRSIVECIRKTYREDGCVEAAYVMV
jgi:solute carrier family 25 carnitine/acylcarnitine transporter 20/29